MASVKSAFRTAIKPSLYRLLGESNYEYFQYLGKLKDIKGRLVEEDELALYPRLIGASDDVIDIGANYAYHTHRMATLCPQGVVHAFEPIPFTFRVCERIVRHFKFDNVRLHQLGVGRENANVTFRVPLADFGGISGGQSHIAARANVAGGATYKFERSTSLDCKIVALDDFLPDLKRLTFVKIDIEGAEYFALEGMRGLLQRFAPVVMLEIVPEFLEGFGLTEAPLRTFAEALGYRFYRYMPASGKLMPQGQRAFEEANYFMLTGDHETRYADIVEGMTT